MILQLISDFPLISNYITVLEDVVGKADKEHVITEARLIESIDDLSLDDPTLLLGPRPEWLTEAVTVIPAPSIRATLGTAGGATKLRWAVQQAITGKYRWSPGDDEYVWEVVTPNTILPLPETVVAVDIEVSGDIRVDEPEDTELLSLAMCWKDDISGIYRGIVYTKEQLQAADVKRILADKLSSVFVLTHNGKFDMRWINAHLQGYLQHPLYPTFDTLLMHHAMYPGAAEHGLKPLAHRILGAGDWEYDIKKHTKGSVAHYERIPESILVQYNSLDVYWTYRLWERFNDLMDDTARKLYEDHTLPASHMLQDVEAYGMHVDLEYAKLLQDNLTGQIEDHKEYLQQYVDNPNSIPQIKKVIKNRWGITLMAADKSTLRNSVERLERFLGDPDLEDVAEYRRFTTKLLDYRAVMKARSTYVTSIVKKVRNDRVRPTFLVHGTSTGRLSSSGPNVQNVTNDDDGRMSMRRMYTATPGYILVGADYSQAELRTMAELSDDALMIADLQEDSPDFFDNMLPSVFPHVDFTVLDKSHRKPFRLKLKRIVYGSSYGLTPSSVAFMLTMEGEPTSVNEAIAIQENYLGRYPGLDAWRKNTLPRVLAGDELITPFGRRFQQDVITDANLLRIQNQAWAFSPQSIASDICLRAAMWVHDAFMVREEFKDCHIIALVHDAIYAEVPEELGEQVRKLIEQKMRLSGAATFKRVPFLTDSHSGKFWNEV